MRGNSCDIYHDRSRKIAHFTFKVYVTGATLWAAYMTGANLNGTIMPDGKIHD
jgi:hypothetical protein